MNSFQFLTESSPFLIILCLLAGICYAALLYFRSKAFNQVWRIALAIFRGALVSCIAFLLFNPFMRIVENKTIKPLLVLLADNSESMAVGNSKEKLAEQYTQFTQLKEQLANQDLDVELRTFEGTITSDNSSNLIKPTFPLSNISASLEQINSDFEGRNLAGVVMLSDGIVTEGLSPETGNYSFPIHTLGSGDTIPRTDIILKSVSCNRIAYSGNKMPIEASIQHFGYSGTNVQVQIKEGNTVLAAKVVKLNSSGLQTENFIIDAGKAGLRHLEVIVAPTQGEFNTNNNLGHAYVEVIESKEKILILAAAPHPDIKVFRNALETALNYEVTLCVAGIDNYKPDKYDAVILHHLPSKDNAFTGQLDEICSKFPCFFVVGNNSNLPKFNNLSNLLKINGLGANPDKVGARYNSEFDLFTWNAEGINLLDKYPPIDVPFGNYQVNPQAKVILQQMVGSTANGKPIFLAGTTSTTRQAVWVGDEIWSWYIQEYVLRNNQNTLNELIRKTCQFLSTKEDKRRLRVQPVQREFSEMERVVFEAESYNQIYEKVYGTKIKLAITDNKGKARSFTLATSESNSRMDLGTLPPGIYSFKAEATVNGKQETQSGQFLIRSYDVETTNTTANWGIMRELSKRNNGIFLPASNMQALPDYLAKQKPKALLQSTETNKELIDLKNLFFILIALATLEWTARKWLGGV